MPVDWTDCSLASLRLPVCAMASVTVGLTGRTGLTQSLPVAAGNCREQLNSPYTGRSLALQEVDKTDVEVTKIDLEVQVGVSGSATCP